jgi:hypothetical protein
MYTHVSKCKNDKINISIKIMKKTQNIRVAAPTLSFSNPMTSDTTKLTHS